MGLLHGAHHHLRYHCRFGRFAGGMIFKGVPLWAPGTSAAIFIILMGTVGAVLNAFPISDVKNIPKLFTLLFINQKTLYSNDEVITLFFEYCSSPAAKACWYWKPRWMKCVIPFCGAVLKWLFRPKMRKLLRIPCAKESRPWKIVIRPTPPTSLREAMRRLPATRWNNRRGSPCGLPKALQ